MEDYKRLIGVFVLGLVTLFAGLFQLEDHDPFPLQTGSAVMMEYAVNPFDHRVRTVTDREAVQAVITCLNTTERTEDRRGSPMERQYHLRFLRPDGKYWSAEIWEDGMYLVVHGKNSSWAADCTELCDLLSKIWHAQKNGEIE